MKHNYHPIISSPLIPGDSICLSMDDNWLFHYTTAESFFKIIKSLKLKTSRLEKLNDLNEINYEAYSQLPIFEMVKYKHYIERQCSITCFSHHSLYPFKNQGYFLVPGCCNPSMWAHYAGNISGVCLCLNRDKLHKENQKIFGNKIEIKEVHYETNFNPFQKKDTMEEFLKQNGNNIFFLKDVSWQNESEVRLLLTEINPDDEEPMISIADSLEAIVFSQKFWSNNKKDFIEEILCPDSFLGNMCPIHWLMLTSSNVAYDAGEGIPLLLDMELRELGKGNNNMADKVTAYKKKLQEKYQMI